MSCECPICKGLVVLSQNDETHDSLSATRCGHTFHGMCLKEWLSISKTCPKCRVAVKDSQITKKLYFDVPDTDKRDPAIIDAELESLKIKLRERDAENKDLKKSVLELTSEGEIMKSEILKMQMEMEAFHSQLISVTRKSLKMAATLSGTLAKKGNKSVWNLDVLDERLEKSLAFHEDVISKNKCCLELGTAAIHPRSGNLTWNFNMRMMKSTMGSVEYRLDVMEDSQNWMLNKLEKSNHILKTTLARHQGQLKLFRQVAQQEIDSLKAKIKSDRDMQSTIINLEEVEHPVAVPVQSPTSALQIMNAAAAASDIQVPPILFASFASSSKSTSGVNLLPRIGENATGLFQERVINRLPSSEGDTTPTTTVSQWKKRARQCSGSSGHPPTAKRSSPTL